MTECDMCGDYTGGEPRHAICALAMALHKTRWSNDADEFNLVLARERAADLISSLEEQGFSVEPPPGPDEQCPMRCLGIVGHDGPHQADDWINPNMISLTPRTGPILQEEVDDIYGGIVPPGRWVVS